MVSIPPAQSPIAQSAVLLHDLTADFDRLAPQTIRPADGYIKYPYLIPAGYYNQMWDWDGFFIGLHWANQDPANAKYLRDWVLGFAGSADEDGYVAGCITPKGPRPLFGKFAMKPFLAQGAVIAAEDLHDYEWIRPVWPAMKRVLEYRRRTQYDEKWKLWFWDNAMQSGADNNAALTNDPKTERDPRRRCLRLRHAGISRDVLLADHWAIRLARAYAAEALATRHAILRQLWSPQDAMFWNRRRDTGVLVRVVAWSNFLPLVDGLIPRDEGRRMISLYLLNPAQMRPITASAASRFNPAYNNQAIINPYSNWRGPSGSTPTFSTGSLFAATDSTTKPTGWPSPLRRNPSRHPKVGLDARRLRRRNRRRPRPTMSNHRAKIRRLCRLEPAGRRHAPMRSHSAALHDFGDQQHAIKTQPSGCAS